MVKETLYIFLGGMGVITFLVRSIGLASVMLVSVIQRRRERRINSAVGAVLACILSRLFPALRKANVNLAQALRYKQESTGSRSTTSR